MFDGVKRSFIDSMDAAIRVVDYGSRQRWGPMWLVAEFHRLPAGFSSAEGPGRTTRVLAGVAVLMLL
jgi:hypothetical protein